MGKIYLTEIDTRMKRDVYEMFQDIPKFETGSYNACFGLNYEEYKEYLKKEVKRKKVEVSKYDAPTISYIIYDDNYPIGLIGIRTKIDDYWIKLSGNFYYKIRVSKRNMGYGNKALKLALEKMKELGIDEGYGHAAISNIPSIKIIEKCGGTLYKTENGINYYKIKI